MDGLSETRLLSDYHIEGGTGLLPIAKGNTWEEYRQNERY